MTSVMGIDYSSWAIDIVLISETGTATWHRFDLVGDNAFDRTRCVRDVMPARTSAIYDDVIAIGIEEPAGANTRPLNRVQGAILSCLPVGVLVEPIRPAGWRKRVGLSGNATKREVAQFGVGAIKRSNPMLWKQDAFDAYCIALAIRNSITIGEAA